RLRTAIEGIADLGDYPSRHIAVDLASEFDEPSVDPKLARFPGQVKRIYRNTVPAEAGARIVGYESERLGGSGSDDLMDIDPHLVGNNFHLVDETDVHGTVDI